MMKEVDGLLTEKEEAALLQTLKKRFETHSHRHPSLKWKEVEMILIESPDKLSILYKMEETGGEPDVVELEKDNNSIIFVDCSRESPKGRRSLCYDRAALEARKKHKPKHNAIELAQQMGIDLLTEKQYRQLQAIEAFDLKSSSWIQAPERIRSRGGALFCDRRYDTVFVYHNGAESYYAARGFRGYLIIR